MLKKSVDSVSLAVGFSNFIDHVAMHSFTHSSVHSFPECSPPSHGPLGLVEQG